MMATGRVLLQWVGPVQPATRRRGRLLSPPVDDATLLEVLDETSTAIRTALGDLDDWGLAGTRAGQYLSDLAAEARAGGANGAVAFTYTALPDR